MMDCALCGVTRAVHSDGLCSVCGVTELYRVMDCALCGVTRAVHSDGLCSVWCDKSCT